jgi:hypothetical protein
MQRAKMRVKKVNENYKLFRDKRMSVLDEKQFDTKPSSDS